MSDALPGLALSVHPGDMTTEAISMMRSRCKPCGQEFDLLALPAEVRRTVDAIKSARCPICGSGANNHTLAPSRELTAEEAERFAKVEAENGVAA